MAVEAHHLNLFPPQQLLPNRGMMMNTGDASFINTYNNPHAGNFSSLLPLSGTTTTTAASVPYNPLIADSLPQKTVSMKSDSARTYFNGNNLVPVPRKRSRDSISTNYRKDCNGFSFLGQDISLHFHNQQFTIDNLISQHMENVREELEEKRRRQARRLMEAIEIGVTRRLKEKEEQIENIAKLNHALEERVKSLYIENQIWRDLAQTNEATANALRSNLEQVLSQIRDDAGATVFPTGVEEDVESCCGSTDKGGCTIAEGAQDKEEERRMCRKCGKEESSVLILPCRHLCVCAGCGSTLHTCPACNSFKNATVHVNIS